MNKKIIPLCLFSLLIVGCNNTPTSQENNSSNTTDYSSYVCTDEDYTNLFNAMKLVGNDTFTGYRLKLSFTSKISNERVYNEQRYVYIDRTNNYYEFEQTITQIAPSTDNMSNTITSVAHVYYDQGSSYVLQDDNSYKQIDGTVTQSSLIFTFNPSKDSFTDIQFKRNYNVYTFNGTIVSSKANTLFNTTGLDNITDATMSINVTDNKLDTLNYSYTQNNIKVDAEMLMFYDSRIITLPEVR